jgi:uncharacterized protein (DUF2235 family)
MGTANDATVDTFSNVYAINQIISDHRRVRMGKTGRFKHRTQITFYLPGIGTKFTVRRPSGGILSWFGRTDRVRQQIFGDDLEQIVLRAYVDLCANYRPGDNIVLIGFSRGAVAARIFSRLVSDFGILTSETLLYLDRMWNEFMDISEISDDVGYRGGIATLQTELQKQAGKEILHVPKDKPISFLGLFDTVVGPADNFLSKNFGLRDLHPASGVKHAVHLMSMHDARQDFGLVRLQRGPIIPETLREIWVPGVHSDVGGGYQDDMISNVALLTMCEMLETYAEVAIDQSAHEETANRVRAQIKLNRIVVNPEPQVRMRKSRSEMIKTGDEVHPLHWFLINKKIYWKHTSIMELYKDRLNQSEDTSDTRLRNRFATWVDV